MCSIGEDDFGDEGGVHAMKADEPATNGVEDLIGICKKCNTEEIAVKLNFKEAECKSCFLTYARHKFRATLGSSKILPRSADVLVIFDGSPESLTLLDMAYYAQTQNTFKRLHCNLKVLFIDDLFLEESRSQVMPQILEALSKYNVKSFYIPLVGKSQPVEIAHYQVSIDLQKEEEFIARLSNISSTTSRQDCVNNIRKNVIRSAATHLNCQFAFLSDTSPDLARIFLTNVSLGRGGSTALDVSLVDDREESVKLVRPLKDLNELEVEYYTKLNNLTPITRRVYGENEGSLASIQNLTKDFVENLQQNYGSTVSTVFRTGDKISAAQGDEKCELCHSNLDYRGSKTLLAVEFSRIACEEADKSLEAAEKLEAKAEERLNEHLKEFCHGCRNILRSYKGDMAELSDYLL